MSFLLALCIIVRVNVSANNNDEKVNRCPWASPGAREWKRTRQTITEFTVAGVNLATYGLEDQNKQKNEAGNPSAPYELYDSFNIGDQIVGSESWWDLLRYRQLLQRPMNSFYYDKVALKRWLPTLGIDTPRPHAIKYAHELAPSRKVPEETKALLSLFPKETDFVAKPSHMSLTHGSCIVSYDEKSKIYRLSTMGTAVTDDVQFHPQESAKHLANHMHMKTEDWESWTLHNVLPGIIIEERFTALDCYECPPPEFQLFTIWGRVWITQLNYVEGQNKWMAGNLHRNGTLVKSDRLIENPLETWLDWVDFPYLVSIAERLGAHKDMLRVDIFAGLPAGSPSLRKGATREEKLAEVQYAVSEYSFHPTTILDDEVTDEGARLWIAGYKVGNYRVVPNTEVSPEFLKTYSLSPASTGPGVGAEL